MWLGNRSCFSWVMLFIEQRMSYQVQLNRMRQNKNSPEDKELQNPLVLSTCLIDICILFSDGKMRDPGLRHHYSALKTAGYFLEGFGSTNHKPSVGSWVQKSVGNAGAITEFHGLSRLFSGRLKFSKVKVLMSYHYILNFLETIKKQHIQCMVFRIPWATATTLSCLHICFSLFRAIPFQKKNC